MPPPPLVAEPVVGGPLVKPSGLDAVDGAPSSQVAGRAQEELMLEVVAVVDTIGGRSSVRSSGLVNADSVPGISMGAAQPAEVQFFWLCKQYSIRFWFAGYRQ
jgi:hypothetical protein